MLAEKPDFIRVDRYYHQIIYTKHHDVSVLKHTVGLRNFVVRRAFHPDLGRGHSVDLCYGGYRCIKVEK